MAKNQYNYNRWMAMIEACNKSQEIWNTGWSAVIAACLQYRYKSVEITDDEIDF